MFGPIRHLILAAALFLPISFFVWFWFAAVLVQPAAWLSKLVILNWLPQAFTGLELDRYWFDWITTLPVDPAEIAAAGGRAVAATMTVNPMIYGYGLPVIAGLALATPMPKRERFIQILIGFAAVTLIQTNGVVWETVLNLALRSGPEGAVITQAAGLNNNFLAFMYQLGYLIIPAIVPVLLWAMMNRKFIEKLIAVDHFDELDPDTKEAEPMTHLPDQAEVKTDKGSVS